MKTYLKFRKRWKKNLLKKANNLFQNAKFQEALDLYQEASTKFGYQYLDLNIEICKKRLKASKRILSNCSKYSHSKPSIAVLITSKENLKYYPQFSSAKDLPFNLRIYFNTSDGIRPLHNIELLNVPENTILPVDEVIVTLPESDFAVTLEEDELLSEKDLENFIEFKTGIRENNPTLLNEIKVHQKKVIPGRVSVIISTYKRPDNLSNALRSVVDQNYKDIEVIVVSDNGYNSEFSLETVEIVNAYKDTDPNCQVILLEHSVNRNGAAARNTGILHASGEYICFLDDDDIYLPGRLSKSIEALMTKKKTIGAVYCGYFGWDSPENDIGRYISGDLTREILLLEYTKHYLHTNTATYKREVILNLNGFDETYVRHQDLELNLRFFEQYEIDVYKEVLVKLNPEPSDISNHVYDMDLLHLKSKFLTRFKATIERFPPDEQRDIYAMHHNAVFRQNSNKSEAIKYYLNQFHDYSAQILFRLLDEDEGY